MQRDAYREAGVDIDAGDTLVERIKPWAKRTARPEVIGGLGSFGGLFRLGRYRDPVLVSGTDGVGTKLLVAQQFGRHETIGEDLVAMCVNDIAVLGAEPLFFLDYFATGKLDVDEAESVIKGIARGCEIAGCALLGGETAEMPGMYSPGHYDLAGFAVGVVERDALLDGTTIVAGDTLVGIPSSGLHSNGYSLVRKLLLDPTFSRPSPSDALGARPFEPGTLDSSRGMFDGSRSLADELLLPTTIYAKSLLALRETNPFKGAAHITGGGLPGNVPRMLPPGLGVRMWRGSWRIPPIFALLQQTGGLTEDEMLRTFNCGLGMVLAVAPDRAEALAAAAGGTVVGEVTAEEGWELR